MFMGLNRPLTFIKLDETVSIHNVNYLKELSAKFNARLVKYVEISDKIVNRITSNAIKVLQNI